jgi:hypothetical protein
MKALAKYVEPGQVYLPSYAEDLFDQIGWL